MWKTVVIIGGVAAYLAIMVALGRYIAAQERLYAGEGGPTLSVVPDAEDEGEGA